MAHVHRCQTCGDLLDPDQDRHCPACQPEPARKRRPADHPEALAHQLVAAGLAHPAITERFVPRNPR